MRSLRQLKLPPLLGTLCSQLVVPVLLLAYATSYYLEVRQLPRPQTNLLLVEPVYFVLLACCLLFAAIKVAAAVREASTAAGQQAAEEQGAAEAEGEEAEPIDLWRSLAFVGLTTLYVGLIGVVGFVVTTLGYLVAMSFLLGVRSPSLLLALPAALVLLIYAGMNLWLNLPLPRGLLF